MAKLVLRCVMCRILRSVVCCCNNVLIDSQGLHCFEGQFKLKVVLLTYISCVLSTLPEITLELLCTEHARCGMQCMMTWMYVILQHACPVSHSLGIHDMTLARRL